MKSQKGFTLIELLIVIGIIAILASAVIVAINPGQQFEHARNATRRSELSTVASAIHSWAALENNGVYPDCIPDSGDENPWRDINDGTADCTPADGGAAVTLEALLADYINQLPTPPNDGELYEVQMHENSIRLQSDDDDEWPVDEYIVQ